MKKVVVSILICCFVFSLCACGEKAPTWQEQYDLGVRYLTEGNYQEAIIAFTAAIEIDPKQADAYESLAEVYIAMGDQEKAIEILSQGYEATEDEALRDFADSVRLEIRNAEAAKEYLKVLEKWQNAIDAYNWQCINGKNTPVAFCDLSGDGVPEMIFIWATDEWDEMINWGDWDEATLEIWTYANGTAKQIFSKPFGDERHGKTFSLFQITGSGNLYLDSLTIGEAIDSESVEEYTFNAAAGTVEVLNSLGSSYRPTSNDGVTWEKFGNICRLNDVEIEPEEYDRRKEEILQKKMNIVLQGGGDIQTGGGMTCSEAIVYLSDLAMTRTDAAENASWERAYIEQLKSVGNQIDLDHSVAIANVCGDSTPELLYITTKRNTRETSYTNNTNTLHVITYNGIVRYEVFTLELQFKDDAWPVYAFSVAGGRNRLVAYEMFASEHREEIYSVYTFSNGIFSETERLSYATGYYGDGRSDYEEYYTYGDQEISESQFDDYRRQLESYGKIILMDDLEWRCDSPAYTEAKASNPGLSYEDAMRYLAERIAKNEEALLHSEWSEAYREFVLNQEYLDFDGPSDSEFDPYFEILYYDTPDIGTYKENIAHFLYDLNSDGIPELFVYNTGSTAGAAGYNIFGYRNREIVFLGLESGWPAGFVEEYQGLFFSSGGAGYGGYSYIEANDDGTLAREQLTSREMDAYGVSENRVTDDDRLYQALMPILDNNYGGNGLDIYQTAEIREMGWDTFMILYLA